MLNLFWRPYLKYHCDDIIIIHVYGPAPTAGITGCNYDFTHSMCIRAITPFLTDIN